MHLVLTSAVHAAYAQLTYARGGDRTRKDVYFEKKKMLDMLETLML